MKSADSSLMVMIGSRYVWTEIPKPMKGQLKRLMDATFIEVRTVTIHPWYSAAAEGQWILAHGGYAHMRDDPKVYAEYRMRQRVTVEVQGRLTETGEDALKALGMYE